MGTISIAFLLVIIGANSALVFTKVDSLLITFVFVQLKLALVRLSDQFVNSPDSCSLGSLGSFSHRLGYQFIPSPLESFVPY